MSAVPSVGFVLEEALGHATHADNLRNVVSGDARVEARFHSIPFEVAGLGARVPLYNSNWTVRSGVRARRALRADRVNGPLDALFIHTQVPAVLATAWMRKVPTVVSLDATPIQYDQLGEHYAHTSSGGRVERVKFRANQRCFALASRLVTWSSWTKQSLIDDYGVPGDKIVVVPPGVQLDRWVPATPRADDGVVRILFVGGDFERKGGPVLVEAFRRLRVATGPGSPEIELHLVTKADVAEEPGVHVHRGMTPNAPELVSLYHRCDIFCLPTRADMLALVLSEAAAAGLALVSTDVGGIPELVRDGETGLVVRPGSVDELEGALAALVADPERRATLAARASLESHERFDLRTNARRLVDLLLEVAAPA